MIDSLGRMTIRSQIDFLLSIDQSILHRMSFDEEFRSSCLPINDSGRTFRLTYSAEVAYNPLRLLQAGLLSSAAICIRGCS